MWLSVLAGWAPVMPLRMVWYQQLGVSLGEGVRCVVMPTGIVSLRL